MLVSREYSTPVRGKTLPRMNTDYTDGQETKTFETRRNRGSGGKEQIGKQYSLEVFNFGNFGSHGNSGNLF
jgi:hypothetical protein